MEELNGIDKLNNIISNITDTVSIETLDEFLQNYKINDFTNQDKINDIRSLIQPYNKISEGCFGSVYLVNLYGRRVIVKVGILCHTTSILSEEFCNSANQGDLIFRIPKSDVDKTYILSPNYIAEGLISVLVNSYKPYTPSFMKTSNFYYNKSSRYKETYQVGEVLAPTTENIRSVTDYLYYLFQIIQALDVSQRLNKFTHYDLHSGNVMQRNRSLVRGKQQIYIYPLYNGKYLYTQSSVDNVIIDFGFSRYETENTILTPKYRIKTLPFTSTDMYEFNQYVDIWSIIYSSFLNKEKFEIWINETEIENITQNLLRHFLNVGPSEDFGDIIQQAHFEGNWRAIPEFFDTRNNVRSAREMCVYISELINNHKESNQPLDTSLKTDKDYISRYLDRKSFPGDKKSVVQKSINNKEQMTNQKHIRTNITSVSPDYITTVDTENPISEYNIDMRYKHYHYTNHKRGPFDKQFIRVANIQQNQEYKYHIECCKIDPKKYMKNPDIKAGIAINAGFFDITKDYMPVGVYKNSNIFVNNGYPAIFKDWYRGICITSDNKLIITDLEDMKNYENCFSSGPILIQHGASMITENILSTTEIFKCRQPIVEGQRNQDEIEGIRNCNKMVPGELYHASNINPRSALIIDNNENVYFVQVEGRDSRGDGMDLSQLTQFCHSYIRKLGNGARVKHAINLDGGTSSEMVWKAEGDSNINIYNPEHKLTYHVGTILSYIKK
jgi:exopolysaccharide biosynthesis protein